MVKRRRRHTAAYKLRVALDALEGSKTISQLPSEHEIHATRFEPGNGNLWKIGLASIFQHGSALDLQHPPGRTVNSRCLHHLPAHSQQSSQHRRPRPRLRQRLPRKPIAQRQIREHISQQHDLARHLQTDLTAYCDLYSHERPHPPKCTLSFPFRGPDIGTHHTFTFRD